jgi:galactose-1-phosphate uridylyltransferase
MEFRKILRNQIEYRFDPLTGEQSRINPARARRPKQAEADVDLKGIIERSRETCVFCPGRLEEKTPTFSGAICPEGRIRIGKTVIFPNLNPFGEHHAVGTLSEEHFLDLDQLNAQLIIDNLLASLGYILSVHAYDHKAIWPIWVWNYMPPSAGSIIHPHVQILVERGPVPHQAQLLEISKRYFDLHTRNYWIDLVDQEKRQGERFILENDTLSILASFAPRGFNEIQFIFKKSTVSELNQREVDDFAQCMTQVLSGYKRMGVGSFNLLSYSGPVQRKTDHYFLHMKLFSRPYPKGVYTNDTGPMERGYGVWVIDTLPEEVAEKMKPFLA